MHGAKYVLQKMMCKFSNVCLVLKMFSVCCFQNDTPRLTEEIIDSLSPDDLMANNLVPLTTEDIIVQVRNSRVCVVNQPIHIST